MEQFENLEKFRLQFDDFELHHFEIAAIWEFAINEELIDEQDETTLRPCLNLRVADPSEGIYIVQAEFETLSGRKLNGLCSPSIDSSLSAIQPYIFTNVGKVMLWYGIAQPSKEEKTRIYQVLEANADSLFPIRFKAKTQAKGVKLEGKIEGFMWLEINSEKIIIEK